MILRILLAFALLAPPVSWAGRKPAPPKKLSVDAVIVSFTDFGARDVMKDHAEIHYATVKLRVISPADLKGRELTVMQETPVSKNAILRKKGRRVSFKIQRGYQDSQVLFLNALEDLKLLP